MNDLFKQNKKAHIIILILSILSIVPFVFFLFDLFDLQKASNMASIKDKFIIDLLSQKFTNYHILYPFIFGCIIWSTQAILSAYFYYKKYLKLHYSILSIFVGGIGMHSFVLLFYAIPIKSLKLKKINNKVKLISVSVTMLMMFFSSFLFLAIYNPVDQPFLGKSIAMSLDKKTPNLIEIFSDGFDNANEKAMANDVDFKEFNYFNKFQTAGPITHRSILNIFDDFKRNNPFVIMHKNQISSWEYSNFVFKHTMMTAGVNHLNKIKAKFSSRNIINPINLSNSSLYGVTTTGSVRDILRADKTLNVTNWSGARDDLNHSHWGISKYSPDISGYEWLNRNMVLKPKIKGARVFISDLITHRKFLNGKNGNFSLFNNNLDNQFANLRNRIKKLIHTLKEKKLFDNTMIVVYGDHSNHAKITNEKDIVNDGVRKSESALMIKYPKQSQFNKHKIKMNIINNRYIFAPQVNSIIDHYFTNDLVNNTNPLDFFKVNKFDNLERPVFFKDDAYVMAKWDNNVLRVIGYPNYKIIKFNDTQKQIDTLNKVVI